MFGAFGAHLLRSSLEQLGTAQIWQTAVLYHLVHAVVLLVLSGWRPVPRFAYYLILIGVAIFSGSLYAMALTNFKWFGAITPARRYLYAVRLADPGAGEREWKGIGDLPFFYFSFASASAIYCRSSASVGLSCLTFDHSALASWVFPIDSSASA